MDKRREVTVVFKKRTLYGVQVYTANMTSNTCANIYAVYRTKCYKEFAQDECFPSQPTKYLHLHYIQL